MDTKRETAAMGGLAEFGTRRAETEVPGPRAESGTVADSEWNALGLRPVAHWVLMPTGGGQQRLSMVWEVPAPIPALSFGS